MLIFIDTEFTDFINTKLISIGLVSRDEKIFYAELPLQRCDCSPFVKEVVLPLLGKIEGAQCTHDELKNRLRAWLEQFRNNNEPVVICYDYIGDWTLFCSALNDEIPKWICGVDIYEFINSVEQELFFIDSNLEPHHALHDAMANRAAFDYDLAELSNVFSQIGLQRG